MWAMWCSTGWTFARSFPGPTPRLSASVPFSLSWARGSARWRTRRRPDREPTANHALRRRFAIGLPATATWSMSAGVTPACCRQYRIERCGNPVSYFCRVNRSSSTADSTEPSTIRAAEALEWYALIPSTTVTTRPLKEDTLGGSGRPGSQPKSGSRVDRPQWPRPPASPRGIGVGPRINPLAARKETSWMNFRCVSKDNVWWSTYPSRERADHELGDQTQPPECAKTDSCRVIGVIDGDSRAEFVIRDGGPWKPRPPVRPAFGWHLRTRTAGEPGRSLSAQRHRRSGPGRLAELDPERTDGSSSPENIVPGAGATLGEARPGVRPAPPPGGRPHGGVPAVAAVPGSEDVMGGLRPAAERPHAVGHSCRGGSQLSLVESDEVAHPCGVTPQGGEPPLPCLVRVGARLLEPTSPPGASPPKSEA